MALSDFQNGLKVSGNFYHLIAVLFLLYDSVQICLKESTQWRRKISS